MRFDIFPLLVMISSCSLRYKVSAVPFHSTSTRDLRVVAERGLATEEVGTVAVQKRINWADTDTSEAERKKAENPPPSWLGARFSDPSMLTEEDKKVFASNIHGLQLDSKLTLHTGSQGAKNRGIWSVKSLAGYNGKPSELIAKVMPSPSDSNENFGEVKALKLVGDFVAAGLVVLPQGDIKEPVPVIVMKKKEGEFLHDTAAYRGAKTKEEKAALEKAGKILISKAVGVTAEKHLVYHSDAHLFNALFVMHGNVPVSVQLIDFGIAYSVRAGAKADEVAKYWLKSRGIAA